VRDLDLEFVKPKRADGAFRVLQLTDTHLFADSKTGFLGINTALSLKEVINSVLRQKIDFDLILATGDIAQDYSEQSYINFANMMHDSFDQPVFWVPGNHDDGPKMARVFPSVGISAAKNVIVGDWQFILLNTQVYNAPFGWITPEELNYLRHCLDNHPELYSVVCLHHNAFKVNSAWLDQHELRNKEELIELISHYQKVKLVLCGHVHQEADFVMNGIRYISSPSTSIQFEPLSYNFGLDCRGPGWRYITFTPDGGISTEVYRLPPEMFRPDFAVGGY
jgi:Icc protein